MNRTYRADIVEKDKDTKNPVKFYYISEKNIVDAAIEANNRMSAQKAGKEWRVFRVEEVPGEI